MSKQWQIRRGTTAENNSFTGAEGELTMDTTTKTVRIHDGITQGGFELGNGGGGAIQSESCELRNLGQGISTYTEPFNDLSSLPLFVKAFLVCQEADANYSEGDETSAFGIGDYSCPLIYTYISDGILYAKLFVGEQTFWVPNKVTGAKTNVTNSKWKLKITVYYQ